MAAARLSGGSWARCRGRRGRLNCTMYCLEEAGVAAGRSPGGPPHTVTNNEPASSAPSRSSVASSNPGGCGLTGSASNSSIRVGVGATWTDFATAYFSDLIGNLFSVVDFFGEDVYPDTSGGSPGYATHLQGFVPYTKVALATGKAVVANESSSLRWTLMAAGQGEVGTYWGCASNEWYQDGTKLLWADTVPAAWAAANGFSIWSIFGQGPHFRQDKIGVLNQRYWTVYRTPKPSPPALATPTIPPAG